MKLSLSFLFILIVGGFVEAQTGPGGVGSSTTNKVWLDASTLSNADGSTVGSWADKSGNSLIANTTAGYTRPVFRANQLNGFPSIDFDGTNDFLKINSVPGLSNQSVSWFIVGNFNTMGRSQAMLHFAHAGSSYNRNLRFTICYKNATLNRINSGNLNTSGGGTPALHSFGTGTKLLSTIINNNTIDAYSDGALTGTNTGTFLTPNANDYVTIGRRAYLNDMYLDGNVSEVIVFNYDLNSTERTIVENYLASKYGLSLGNDRYAMEATGHYFAVTGVGQESGNAVTDSEGESGISITNLSSLNDDDYLLWGHDNAGLTENFVSVPTELANVRGTRLDRVWRFDETNDIGTYSFNIDMTGITLGLDPDRYVLLIDDDGDFTNGGTTIDSLNYSYNATTEVATWDLVDFPDGAFVTIGWMPKTIYSVTTGPWEDMNTWSCTCVPTSSVNAVIKNTHVVTVGDASSINSLKVESTGSLLFSGGNELAIKGDLTVLGSIDGTNGLLTFNGTFNQDIDLVTAEIDDLTINNSGGVTMSSGAMNLNGTLTVTSGNFELGTDLITLVSDATSTARIGNSSGSFSGNMIIQRFISSRNDGYSDMSSPVSSATFAGWADDFEFSFTAYVPNWTTPTAWGYSESLWDYVAIETSGTAITPGVGYEVYLDNDGHTSTAFSNTTVDLSGTPNIGDISVPVTFDNDGWNLIGNPYASFIDFTTFRANSSASMSNYFMYYDETIDDFSFGNPGDVIAQSQGFWVEATAAGTVTFHENNKSTSTSSSYRINDEPLFSLRVSSDAIRYTSNTYFKFDDYASMDYEVDHDLSFLKVPAPKAPSLYTHSNDGKRLRINELKAESSLVIPVTFVPGIDGNYVISSINTTTAFNEGYSQVILEDKLLGVYYDLALNDYEFMATINDAQDRFALHLKSPSTDLLSTNEEINFINSAQGVFVNFNFDENKSALIDVFNVAGQQIISGIKANTDSKLVGITLPQDYQGMYIIRVLIDEKIITKRFYKN